MHSTTAPYPNKPLIYIMQERATELPKEMRRVFQFSSYVPCLDSPCLNVSLKRVVLIYEETSECSVQTPTCAL
jgi:hypothetical protein